MFLVIIIKEIENINQSDWIRKELRQEEDSHISGQRREQTVTDLPKAAAVGQALKDLRFPTDKKRILLFLQERSNTNPEYQRMVSLLDKMEDRQYQNVSDVTKAAGVVE